MANCPVVKMLVSTSPCQSITKHPESPQQQSTPEPLELKVPMILRTGTETLVTCYSGVKIEILKKYRCNCYACTNRRPVLPYCKVSASSPIRILTQNETRISPVALLGEDFARGWNKLFIELKVKILSCNLTQEYHITHEEASILPGFDYGCIFRHHVALGPAFAALATRVFYETNTISLDGWNFPPRAVRRYIRRVFVHVKVPFASGWNTLEVLSAAAGGFVGLQHAEIKFDMEAIAEDFDMDEEEEDHYIPTSRIDLNCKGTLEFLYSPSYCSSSEPFRDPEMQQIEELARKLITFIE